MSRRYMYLYMWIFVPSVSVQQLVLDSTCSLDPSLPKSHHLGIGILEVQSPSAAAGKAPLLTETHTWVHTERSPTTDWDSPGPCGNQLLAWLPPQKHKISDPQTISPASLAQYLLNLTYLCLCTSLHICTSVACTTNTWASEPGSHPSCWCLDPHICTYNRKIKCTCNRKIEREFNNKKQTLLSTMHKSALNSNLYISSQCLLFNFSCFLMCVPKSHGFIPSSPLALHPKHPIMSLVES